MAAAEFSRLSGVNADRTLVERLGADPSDRLVIVHCRGFGVTHAANLAVRDAFDAGVATTASLMMPCPWAREAAALHRGEDVGIMLTMNSELDLYRWSPLTHAPSLLDGDSGFPRSVQEFWDHADLDEVRREARAQLERAIVWGFDVSFIGSHLGALVARPEFFDVALDVAVDFQLPMSLPPVADQAPIGFRFRDLADAEGIVFPDDQIDLHTVDADEWVDAVHERVRPGVTEIFLSPARASDELMAADPAHAMRSMADDIRCRKDGIVEAFNACGLRRVGFRDLRDLQRRERPHT